MTIATRPSPERDGRDDICPGVNGKNKRRTMPEKDVEKSVEKNVEKRE
jgi:hypothetical protein